MEKSHIMLAEDDLVLSRVIIEELESAGYKVSHTKDGEETMMMIGKKRPGLLLLDILMPKIDGMEVLEQIKKDTATKGIPVIMLTMLSSDEDIKKALGLGAVDYIVKSQHAVGEIVDKVNEFFDKGSSADIDTRENTPEKTISDIESGPEK